MWLKLTRLLKPFVEVCQLMADYCYDGIRYLRYSGTFRVRSNAEKLIGRIYANYHVIEKGLCLPSPRLGFGADVVQDLMRLLRCFEYNKFGTDQQVYRGAIAALQAYETFNSAGGNHIRSVVEFLQERSKMSGAGQDGGFELKPREYFGNGRRTDFKALAESRHSIRSFSNKPVQKEDIVSAIEIALKTPSVCNRRGYRAYYTLKRKQIDAILSLQNGNRGFGHTATGLLIIAADLSAFKGSGERNQCFIDGGLFGMSVIYALHSLGIATCPLNWSVQNARDRQIRKVAGIKARDSLIMMIAVGHYVDYSKVAISGKEDVSYYLQDLDYNENCSCKHE